MDKLKDMKIIISQIREQGKIKYEHVMDVVNCKNKCQTYFEFSIKDYVNCLTKCDKLDKN
jgi:hypothetical protein